jgi:hypothetical protein
MLLDHAPDKPIGRIVGSVINGTNADLIHAIAPLYLTGSVLDVTYGNGDTAGGWWKRYTPEPFTFHDIAVDGVDFRALPEADGSVDTVCFDPPYVLSGSKPMPERKAHGHGSLHRGSNTKDFRERFGLEPMTRAELLALINDGLAECARVASQWVVTKCMDYTAWHEFYLGHLDMIDRGRALGLAVHDLIVHHTGSGPGGNNIFDVKRARRHHSYLLVFAKGGTS